MSLEDKLEKIWTMRYKDWPEEFDATIALIEEEVRKARLDEQEKIADYINNSYGFEWYPADFKAYHEKRLNQLNKEK